MDANEIKGALLSKNLTLTDVAAALEVTPQHVSQVVNRKRVSPRIESYIAQRIGKPVARVWKVA